MFRGVRIGVREVSAVMTAARLLACQRTGDHGPGHHEQVRVLGRLRIRDLGRPPGGEFGNGIGEVVTVALGSFGAALAFGEDELDPLMHGLVGAVFGSVRRWLNRPDPVLSADRLRATVGRSVWFVLEGHARDAGLVLDPERTVAELVEAALAGSGPAATVGP